MKREEIIKEAGEFIENNRLTLPQSYTEFENMLADFLIQQIGKEQPDTEVEGYQSFFNFMHQEHGLSLLESEMQEIFHEVNKSQKQQWDRERDLQIIDAFLAGRKAGAAFKRAADNEGLAQQYLKDLKLNQ